MEDKKNKYPLLAILVCGIMAYIFWKITEQNGKENIIYKISVIAFPLISSLVLALRFKIKIVNDNSTLKAVSYSIAVILWFLVMYWVYSIMGSFFGARFP